MKVETLMDKLERFGRERQVRIEIIDPHQGVDGPRTWLEIEDVIIEERDGDRVVIIKADINS